MRAEWWGWLRVAMAASLPRRKPSPALRLALRCGTAGLLAAATLLGTGLVGAPAAAEVSEAVEDLLWDLQLVPLGGDPPPLALPGLDGRTYSLADAKGQVVLLYFWATW